jgi:hypothetical protein
LTEHNTQAVACHVSVLIAVLVAVLVLVSSWSISASRCQFNKRT